MARTGDVFITAQVEESRRGSHEQPVLFLVLQAEQPHSPSARLPLAQVACVRIGRSAARVIQREEPGTLVLGLPGRSVSTAHAELRRGPGGWTLVDLGSRNGTFLNGARTQEAPLADGDWIEVGGAFLRFRLGLPAAAGAGMIDTEALVPPAPGLDTLLPEMEAELDKLALVAKSELPLLLIGEAGTGQEVAAREVHTLSNRSGPFVAVHCGSLVPASAEAELFGSPAGAPGAADERPGLFRSADRGTLFLDEIGALPPAAQASLLRAIQRSGPPAGGGGAPGADVRLVAATTRDLAALVAGGRFRDDLLASLSGFAVQLPPLRKRAEDLGLLVSALLHRHFPEREGIAFSVEAARALLTHRWPLNIRELEKALTTAVVLAQGGLVELSHLPEGLGVPKATSGGPATWPSSPSAAPQPTAPPGPGDRPARALPPAPGTGAAGRPGGTAPEEHGASAAPPAKAAATLVEELKSRRVFRSLAGYGLLSFGVLQVVEPVMHGLHWPDEVLSYVVVGLAAGFPLVVVLSWAYDIGARGVERTPPAPAGSAGARGGRVALALLLLASLSAAPVLAWFFLRHPSPPPPPAAPEAPAKARESRAPDTEVSALLQRAAQLERGDAPLAARRDLLDKVLALDAGLAPAWAARARLYQREAAAAGTPEGIALAGLNAITAADKAVALDPELPEALLVRAQVRMELSWDWSGARADLDRTIALLPGQPQAHVLLGNLLLLLDRVHDPEGLAELRKATALDPLDRAGWTALGRASLGLGRIAEGRSAFERALAIPPETPGALEDLGWASLLQGACDPAQESFTKARDLRARQGADGKEADARLAWSTAFVEHARGKTAAARAALARLAPDLGPARVYELAAGHAWTGEPDKAFECLDKASAARAPQLIFLKRDPLLRSLQADPRFAALLRRMGLPVE